MNSDDLKQATVKIADAINKKRRQEIINVYSSSAAFDYIKKMRKEGVFDTGKTKGARMKKVASVPLEVDRFFTKLYGEDYYKDKDFFLKIAPEWRVTDAHNFGGEEDNIKKVIKDLSNA